MRTHLTTTFQKLVLECMSPEHPEMSTEQIVEWEDLLPKIQLETYTLLRYSVFGKISSKLVCRHMYQMQKECTMLLNVLHGYHLHSTEMDAFRLNVMKYLVQIIEHQRQHYGRYLDINTAMPIVLFSDAAKKIETNASLMVTAMTRFHADKRLQALIVGKMTSLSKKGNGTWHQINYLDKLQRCIMDLCTGYNSNITCQLRMLLLRANFNTSAFITYCKVEVDNELAENYELVDQYRCLHNYKREFSTLTYMHKLRRFEPLKPKILEIMLNYVDSELRILDRRNMPVRQNAVANSTALHFKMSVSITVDMLAYLFRLLHTNGVIISSKSELLLFMSRNFSTPGSGQADISLKSVENKYRQVVKKNAIAVKSILLKMLKQLNEEFN